MPAGFTDLPPDVAIAFLREQGFHVLAPDEYASACGPINHPIPSYDAGAWKALEILFYLFAFFVLQKIWADVCALVEKLRGEPE